MFEVWADKNEPTVRLAVRQGSGLPADLGPRDWLSLGATILDSDATRAVEAKGYHFFHSDAPLPDPGGRKNSDAAGA